MQATCTEKTIIKLNNSAPLKCSDTVIAECSLGIKVNNVFLVTLLCTPDALDSLAVGFLQSEGLISSGEEVLNVELDEDKLVVNVTADIGTQVISNVFVRKKPVYTSGCCQGVTFREVDDCDFVCWSENNNRYSATDISRWVFALREKGNIFSKTGGAHMSGMVLDDALAVFHEDIGRHNTIDKVFGSCLLKRIDPSQGLLVTSGRLSGEMVMKCAMRRVPVIVSSGVATLKAIEIAERNNITLIGFVRGSSMNLYTNQWRVEESNNSFVQAESGSQ